MDAEELRQVYDALSVRELKDLLQSRGVSSEGCVEKHDLIDRLLTLEEGADQMDFGGNDFGGSSMMSSPPPASRHSEPSGGGEDAKVLEFCQLTGSDPETASHLLEAMGWNLEDAVSVFLDTGGARAHSAGASSGHAGASSSSSPPHDDMDGEVRAPLPTVRQTLLGGPQPMPMPMPPNPLNPMGGGGGGGHMPGADMLASLLQQAQPMMQGLGVALGGMGTADDPNIEWMFKPPKDLSALTGFQPTRTMAKQNKKWLLVNIQDNENFESHRLNRDLWNDETIQSVIHAEFIFWQRNKTSTEGQQFMSRYQVFEPQLPLIAIIDPRTGSKIVDIKTQGLKPQELSTLLLDFLEHNNLDDVHAPKIRPSLGGGRRSPADMPTASYPSPPNSSATAPHACDQDEEEALRLALEMSMQERNGGAQAHASNLVAAPAPAPAPSSTSPLSASTSSTQEPPRRHVELPPEPPADTPQSELVKIQFRLADGRRVRRNFLQSDKVEILYAFVESQMPDARRLVSAPDPGTGTGIATHDYDLQYAFPAKSLGDMMDQTLQDAKLDNSMVNMRFLN